MPGIRSRRRLEASGVPRAGLAAGDVSNSDWVVCEGSKEEATAFLSFLILLFSSVLHAHGGKFRITKRRKSFSPPSPAPLVPRSPILMFRAHAFLIRVGASLKILVFTCRPVDLRGISLGDSSCGGEGGFPPSFSGPSGVVWCG